MTTTNHYVVNASRVPTPAQRVEARERVRGIERELFETNATIEAWYALVAPFRSADYADGFPHSYTEQAVILSRDLIMTVAPGRVDVAELLAGDVRRLQDMGQWYR